jgi:formylglycine-generating enzyme required for sulfatase activity
MYPHSWKAALLAISLVLPACGSTMAEPGVAAPEVIEIPAGPFVFGSDRAEREAAYRLDEAAYGHSVTREQRWYESEAKRQRVSIGRYQITKNLITNAQYHAFVQATGHRQPGVDRTTWSAYGLIHPYARTRRHAWRKRRPPDGRGNHPVVLVSQRDAAAYAEWLGRNTPYRWRLPTEREWEKAARGATGWRFPWGDTYDSARLNSHDKGPFDTVPVGQFPMGASPYGLQDPAGQVFEWTATAAGTGRRIVKGGSWDDKGCGVCRPAARHSRPVDLKHILIGFRLVREAK